MAESSKPSRPPAGPETLGGALTAGPLSLTEGLRCGHEIASELRDLHQQGRAYGALSAFSVVLTESGAHLLSPRNASDLASPERDVQSFGAIFFRMLNGTSPPATLSASDLQIHGPRTGAYRLLLAASTLALKCLAQGTRLTMQQVALEIRLLCIMARQYETETPQLDDQALPPVPFLVAGAPPAAAFLVQPAQPLLPANPPPGECDAAPLVPLDRDSFGYPTPKPAGEPEPAGLNCPKCNSAAIYVSRARSWFERLLVRGRVPLCRCYQCYHRYVVFGGLQISKNMPVDTPRKYRPHRRN